MMDESLQPETTQPADEVAAALRKQRERTQKFVTQWRESVSGVENDLIAQLEATMRDLAATSDSEATGAEEIQRRHSELAELQQRVDQRNAELTRREQQVQQHLEETLATQCRLDERIERLQSLFEELDERRSSVQKEEAALDANRRAHQSAVDEFEKQRADQASKLKEQRECIGTEQEQTKQQSTQLAAKEQGLAQREQQLVESRQRLARELRVRRKEQLAEIEQRRAELELIAATEDKELEGRIAGFQAELARLQNQSESRSKEVDELQGQLETARSQLSQRETENRELLQRLEQLASTDKRTSAEAAELTAQLAEAREKAQSQNAAAEAALQQSREEQQQLRQQLEQANDQVQIAQEQIGQLEQQADGLRSQVENAGDEATRQQIQELQSERDALLERLSDAEELAQCSTHGNSDAVEELQRRLEAALTEVRELKLRNAKLEERTTDGAPVAEAMDWESQKRKMLAQLEADIDEDDPEQVQDRLTVEGAIRMTDEAVAQKDRELEELRRLLDDQSQNLGGVAVGAAAIAEMLDTDELVQQEREKLEVLQQEWREKLRKAEIDISVERAKIARERAQLEERLQSMEQRSISDDKNEPASEQTPKRGKWLARLGLKDGE